MRTTSSRSSAKPPAPVGTTLTLRVDERSTLIVAFRGTAKGRRHGTRCVAGRRTGRSCTLTLTAPTLVRTARGPGAVRLPISGRDGGARMAAGAYRASVTAIDAAGNRSRPRTVRLTVVPR